MSESLITSPLVINFLVLVCLACYLLACARLVMALRRDTAIHTKTQFAASLTGSLAQIAALAGLMLHSGGIDFSLMKSVALIMATAVLFVSLSSQRFAIQTIQLVLMPVAAITLVLGLALPSSKELLSLSAGTGLHILLSILSYSAFTVSAALALMLSYSNLRLKHHKLTSLVKHVPPLEALENLLYELITLGSVLLALSIATGFIFLDNFFAQHLLHKTVLSILGLAIFSCICIGHWYKGWRGKKIMRWILGAYGALILAYIGSKLVLEWILSGG